MARDQNAERKPSLELVNGTWKLKRCSPSQIKTFELCELKWWLEKRQKWAKKPPGKGVKLGLESHARMEHFLLTGDDIRGRLERVGAHMIEPYLWAAPSAGGGGLVESAVENVRTDSGVEIVGFIDYLVPPSSRGPATIIDHKFRKSIDRYAESEEKLANDPQGIIYAFATARRYSVGRVRFEHHNYQTEGRAYGEARAYLFNAGELDHKWTELQARISKIENCAQIEAVLKVPYNENACGAFGGCDFAKQCPRSPVNSLFPLDESLFTGQGNDLMGLLDEMNNAVAGTTPTQAPAAANTPAVAGKAPRFRKLKAGEAIEGRRYRNGTDEISFEAKAGPFCFFSTKEGAPKKIGADVEIEDLDAQLPDDPPARPRIQIEDKSSDAKPLATGVNPPDAAAPGPEKSPEELAIEAEVNAASEKKGKPGRKPKTESGTALGGLTLFVDCVPNQPHADLSAWVVDLARQLATAGKVEDIRFAPKDHPFAYSGWKGALLKKATEVAPSGLCVIYRSDLTEPVIEALAGVASMVVRG